MLRVRETLTICRQFLHKSIRKKLNYSKYPKLKPEEIVETLARGSGPGGQSVNKSYNAVRLNHLPTGVTVRVHDTRSVEKNREIAWKRIVDAVDTHLNGEDSILKQTERLEKERADRIKEEKKRKRELKEKAKKEALESSQNNSEEEKDSDDKK